MRGEILLSVVISMAATASCGSPSNSAIVSTTVTDDSTLKPGGVGQDGHGQRSLLSHKLAAAVTFARLEPNCSSADEVALTNLGVGSANLAEHETIVRLLGVRAECRLCVLATVCHTACLPSTLTMGKPSASQIDAELCVEPPLTPLIPYALRGALLLLMRATLR
jgi:hypothetical protein